MDYETIPNQGDKKRNKYSNKADNLDLEKYKRILLNKLNDILEIIGFNINKFRGATIE